MKNRERGGKFHEKKEKKILVKPEKSVEYHFFKSLLELSSNMPGRIYFPICEKFEEMLTMCRF